MTLLSRTGIDQLWACWRVNGSTVAPGDGSATANGGFRDGAAISSTRTGTGAYTLLLNPSDGIDANESLPSPVLEGAGAAAEDIRVQQTDDRTFLVTTFAAGVAADRNFKLSVRKVRTTT